MTFDASEQFRVQFVRSCTEEGMCNGGSGLGVPASDQSRVLIRVLLYDEDNALGYDGWRPGAR